LTYAILLHPRAKDSLEKLDHPMRKRVIDQLSRLRGSPEQGKRLKMGGFYSLRIGDYRGIYEIWRDRRTVVILLIDHRHNVYEDLDRWI
jgi:mRNA-degrading endonuclease RelE of RelBE toxin-antitoxin system